MHNIQSMWHVNRSVQDSKRASTAGFFDRYDKNVLDSLTYNRLQHFQTLDIFC